ncbi:MAG TPA: DNA-processing protein DprA [Phycisphaerae bacterium]|nr:DNA-processing protein DprA [Phycisphaerae bacterium]
MSRSAVISPTGEKYLHLHLCPEVGPIRFANLLRELGGIDAALGAGVGRLMEVSQIGSKVAEGIARGREQVDVGAEIELAARHGVRVICLADEEYPAALRAISDPPPCLYIRGALEPEDAVALAIVGTRRCSRYGQEQAERFAALAANAGLTIVSGMARGIDTRAHYGALAAGGRTIAVLGCGLCHLYPPESAELAGMIAEHGAIISELPMNVMPDSGNFPPRNRIIAGLSLGVLVVEAPLRSGALISARLATEYNREVFAVPGRVDTPHAEGCHDLIRSSSAKLVTNLRDILEELGEVGSALMPQTDGERPSAQPSPQAIVSLDENEKKIMGVLGPEPVAVEEVCEGSGLPPQRVAAALTGLQLKGLIHRVGGDLYQAVAAKLS